MPESRVVGSWRPEDVAVAKLDHQPVVGVVGAGHETTVMLAADADGGAAVDLIDDLKNPIGIRVTGIRQPGVEG